MNDGYLKLNQQSDGVNSYGRMVDLLLAWQEVQRKNNHFSAGFTRLSFLRPFRGSVFPFGGFFSGFLGGDSFLRGGFFLRRVRLVRLFRFRPHKGRVYPGFQGFCGDTRFVNMRSCSDWAFSGSFSLCKS